MHALQDKTDRIQAGRLLQCLDQMATETGLSKAAISLKASDTAYLYCLIKRCYKIKSTTL